LHSVPGGATPDLDPLTVESGEIGSEGRP
jgi:hypothetical protein